MRTPQKCFVFGPAHNEPPSDSNPHGNDATGAFHVGMGAWRRFWEPRGSGIVEMRFNNRNPRHGDLRREVLEAMQIGAAGGRFDAVVYFGHGTRAGLSSCRFTSAHLNAFCDAVQACSTPNVAVLLYACSCAADGAAAWAMSERLRPWAKFSMQVMGHAVPGHSFRNSVVRVFPNGGGQVGRKPAPPGLISAWIRAISNPRSTLWMRFPFMTEAELVGELQA